MICPRALNRIYLSSIAVSSKGDIRSTVCTIVVEKKMFECSNSKLLVLAFAALIFIPGLIIGSIGARRLVAIERQVQFYADTTCFVLNVTVETLPFDCDCDECDENKCYAEHFAVKYPIENGSLLISMIHVDRIPRLLKVEVGRSKRSRAMNTRVVYFRSIIVTRVSIIEKKFKLFIGRNLVHVHR
jgi:hypothetical protein